MQSTHNLISKTILTLFAVLLFSFSSCIREDDADLLNHPIHVTGQFDPHFGLPIAYTSLNINDVLALMGDYDQYIDTLSDEELITIKYDTAFVNYYDINQTFSPNNTRKSNTKYGDIVYTYDTIIEGEQTFKLFENLDILKEISVSKVLLNWQADASATVSNNVDTLIDEFGVQLYVDNISLLAFNSENPNDQIELAVEDNGSILVNNMFGDSYETITLLDNYDASPILEIQPDHVKYKASFHVTVPDTAFAIDIANFLRDSLHFESITVKSDVSARFPINLKVERFEQVLDTTAINMTTAIEGLENGLNGIEGVEASIEDSYLTLQIVNGLPLDAKLRVDMCDTNYQSLVVLADTTEGFLSAAHIGPYVNDPTLYVSQDSTITNVKIMLNQERLEKLKQARFIIMTAVLSTPTYNGTQQQVAPKRSDKISIKTYAKIHASAGIDIPITDGPIINKERIGE